MFSFHGYLPVYFLSPGKLNGGNIEKEVLIQSSFSFDVPQKQNKSLQNNSIFQLEVKERNSPEASSLMISFLGSVFFS